MKIHYPKFNVKIVASHVGLDVGPDGASHQCLEDIALMRAIPGMVVLSPTDDQMEDAIHWMLDYDGPVYLRTGRSNVPFELKDWWKAGKFKFNKINAFTHHRLNSYSRAIIMATGNMVYKALQAQIELSKMGIGTDVFNISTLKPFDLKDRLEYIQMIGKIVTCEDHNIHGGLFSIVAEKFADLNVQVYPIAIEDLFGRSGDPEELYEFYGIDVDSIVNKVKEIY